jgi:hypothetical protein
MQTDLPAVLLVILSIIDTGIICKQPFSSVLQTEQAAVLFSVADKSEQPEVFFSFADRASSSFLQ